MREFPRYFIHADDIVKEPGKSHYYNQMYIWKDEKEYIFIENSVAKSFYNMGYFHFWSKNKVYSQEISAAEAALRM